MFAVATVATAVVSKERQNTSEKFSHKFEVLVPICVREYGQSFRMWWLHPRLCSSTFAVATPPKISSSFLLEISLHRKT